MTTAEADKVKPTTKAVLKAREEAKLQKATVTTRISETTRTLAFGSLASCYALLLADRELADQFASVRQLLLVAGAAGIIAIILDAAQYVFGYINVEKALKRPDNLFPKDWSKRWRTHCFYAKQAFAYLAALLLLVAIGSRIASPETEQGIASEFPLTDDIRI